jgi:hypothetical protein
MKREVKEPNTTVKLKKKLLSEQLDVPLCGASFAKARWIWPF